MKVYKPNELSLFIKPFGLQNRLYMAYTLMVYFDLTAPDGLLTEQELWKTVPAQLGPMPVVDTGMAKPRGEFLVAGSCFAPRGQCWPAAPVSVRVGAVGKTLNVFGDRFWERGAGGLATITDPESFAEMPLTWDRAFGGLGFDKNPAGRGIQPVRGADGRERVPLPNVELPDRLVGSPADRPDPAGFGPLDFMSPVRQKKTGTYDDKWLKERWPYFPDDMNYEFFNAAAEDQYLPAFFSGAEAIEIRHMHPDYPVITSRLPQNRVRCFVTRQKDLKSRAVEDLLFEEITTRIDTVWLFPNILRGLVLHRGTGEILDEEYMDVQRIFLAVEKPDAPAKTIEAYRDEQLRTADRAVTIDMAPLQAAQAKIAKVLRKAKRLPKEVEEIKKRATGRSPVMPRTPADMQGMSREIIAGGEAVLNQLEALARDMHAKYGHLVAIDLEQFDRWRERIKGMSQKVDDSVAKLEKAQQEAADAKTQMGGMLKEHVPPEHLEKAGIDPDNLLAPPSVNPWHDRGFPRVVAWRRRLEVDRAAQKALADLGFEADTVRRAWLGINSDDQSDRPSQWGLHKPGDADAPPVALPAGLVLPRFQDAVLVRIAIRPGDAGAWLAAPEQVVTGSDETPLFMPAPPGDGPAPVAVRVADELQALLVEQEAGDAVSVIALADPSADPGPDAAKDLKAAPVFLVALPEAAPDADFALWAKQFPNAQALRLPKGRTVFDARADGADLRRWILDALPKELAQPHRLEIALPEAGKAPTGSPLAGMTLPIPDIKGIVEKTMQEIRAFHQPKFDAIYAEKAKAEALAKEALAKAGHDPEQIFAAAQNAPRETFADVGDRIAGELAAKRDRLRDLGVLTPETEAQFNDAAARAYQMGHEGEVKYQEGMAKITAGKQQIADAMAKVKAGELPPEARAKFAEAGMDPDRMKKRTREDVIAMHGRGETLAGAILNGVDLSGLDLTGADLTGAQLQKTLFAGTRLDKANLTQVIALEADFTTASLRGATLDRGILNKAKLKGADFGGARLKQVVVKDADLSGADFSGADLEMVTLQKCQLQGLKMSGTRAYLSIIEGDATGSVFAGARFNKCILRKIVLDGADFSVAALNSTLFMDARGSGVTFAGANLDKLRMGKGTVMAGADFRNIQMHQGCLREADLSGADFSGAVIRDSLIEFCDLRKANLRRVPARGTRLTKTDLEGADMYGIDLYRGSLRKARLVNTDLRGANLCAVDLYKAVMGETRLDGANLKLTLIHKREDLLP